MKTATKPSQTVPPAFVRLVNGSSVMAVLGDLEWSKEDGVWLGTDVDNGDRWLCWDIDGDIAISYRRA